MPKTETKKTEQAVAEFMPKLKWSFRPLPKSFAGTIGAERAGRVDKKVALHVKAGTSTLCQIDLTRPSKGHVHYKLNWTQLPKEKPTCRLCLAEQAKAKPAKTRTPRKPKPVSEPISLEEQAEAAQEPIAISA